MHVVLTGATGFLGSHLLARMLSSGARVTVLVRDTPEFANTKLRRALAATGAPDCVQDSLKQHVRLLRTRLDHPTLGLCQEEFRELADSADEVWHCASLIALDGGRPELHRANVDTTRQVLGLATVGERSPRMFHVSTAFVAGARREGVVYEDELDDSHGFLTPYEESKYHAEVLVRDWSRKHGRPATVFRPGVLLSDRPLVGRVPRHPLAVVGNKAEFLAAKGPDFFRRRFGITAAADGTVALRMIGSDDAVMNLLPVEYAAEAMLCVAQHAVHDSGTRTHHVVHPVDTPIRRVLDVMQRLCPWMRLQLVSQRPEPLPAELYLESLAEGVAQHAGTFRCYDRTNLDDVPHMPHPPGELDKEYLDATLPPAAGRTEITEQRKESQ